MPFSKLSPSHLTLFVVEDRDSASGRFPVRSDQVTNNINPPRPTAEKHTSLSCHAWEQKIQRERTRQGAAVDLPLPSEGLASERSHVERPGSPLGSRSCTHLCSFPPSHAVSFLPSLSLQLHLPFRWLHSSLFFPAAFLRHTNSPYLSPLSPLCPAPDLLPQFSVQLEFEINPISSDPSTRLALIALPPSLPLQICSHHL